MKLHSFRCSHFDFIWQFVVRTRCTRHVQWHDEIAYIRHEQIIWNCSLIHFPCRACDLYFFVWLTLNDSTVPLFHDQFNWIYGRWQEQNDIIYSPHRSELRQWKIDLLFYLMKKSHEITFVLIFQCNNLMTVRSEETFPVHCRWIWTDCTLVALYIAPRWQECVDGDNWERILALFVFIFYILISEWPRGSIINIRKAIEATRLFRHSRPISTSQWSSSSAPRKVEWSLAGISQSYYSVQNRKPRQSREVYVTLLLISTYSQ